MPGVYEVEIEAAIDDALDADGIGGRYAALLNLYLTLPDDRTDLLFVAIARRLSLAEISPSAEQILPSSATTTADASDHREQDCERVAFRREVVSRRTALVEQHRSIWERLTGFLPRRVRS